MRYALSVSLWSHCRDTSEMSDDNCLFLHSCGKHISAKEKWEVGYWMGLRVVIKTFLWGVVDVYIISKNWGELLSDEENWLLGEGRSHPGAWCTTNVWWVWEWQEITYAKGPVVFKMEAYLLSFSFSHFHSLPQKTKEHGVWRNESKLPTYNDIFWSLVNSFLFRDQKIVGSNYLVQLGLQLLLERHRQNPKSLSVSVTAEIWTQTPQGPWNTMILGLTSCSLFLNPRSPWGSQQNCFMNNLLFTSGYGNHWEASEESRDLIPLEKKKNTSKTVKSLDPIWRMERDINYTLYLELANQLAAKQVPLKVST